MFWTNPVVVSRRFARRASTHLLWLLVFWSEEKNLSNGLFIGIFPVINSLQKRYQETGSFLILARTQCRIHVTYFQSDVRFSSMFSLLVTWIWTMQLFAMPFVCLRNLVFCFILKSTDSGWMRLPRKSPLIERQVQFWHGSRVKKHSCCL